MSKEIITYTKINDNSNIHGLPFFEKMKAIIFNTFEESGQMERRRMKDMEAVTEAEMKLRADLIAFLRKATKRIREGKCRSVTLDIDSRFEPVLHSVLNSSTFKHYKVTEIHWPKTSLSLDYLIRIRLEVAS